MWKEAYHLGVPHLDRQHKEMFERVQEFLRLIDADAGVDQRREIVSTLVQLMTSHFQDEEDYQREIHFWEAAVHKKSHDDYYQLLLRLEEAVIQSGYSTASLKDMAGSITAWLVYHVAGDDLKMARPHVRERRGKAEPTIQVFKSSMREALQTLAGLNPAHMKERLEMDAGFQGDVDVHIDLIGDLNGKLTYSYSKEFATNLFHNMTYIRPSQLDELVCSAMAEVTNIFTGSSTVRLSEKGIACSPTTPVVSMVAASPNAGVVMDTGIGSFKFSAYLDNY